MSTLREKVIAELASGPMSLAELSRRLDKPYDSVKKAVNCLENDELVTKQPNFFDMRTNTISLKK